MKNNAKVTKDLSQQMMAGVKALTGHRVYVGVPEAKNERDDDSPIGNATIGYLGENGVPENNLPARPHLVPGVDSAKKVIASIFRKMGENAIAGDVSKVMDGFEAAGQVGRDAVKKKLTDGLEPPLAESTLLNRGDKSSAIELQRRAEGKEPSSKIAKPYIRNGEYYNSITYVVRDH